MIFTTFSANDHLKSAMLAANLATLYVRNHRKTLLIDVSAQKYSQVWSARRNDLAVKPKLTVRGTQNLLSELEDPYSYMRLHYQDIIIDTDGVDARHTDAILEASDVLVLTVWLDQRCLGLEQELIEHIESARLFNPLLRVLIVRMQALAAASRTDKQEDAALSFFTSNMPAASLAKTVIQESIEERHMFEQGYSAFEGDPCHQRAIAELNALQQEILNAQSIPLDPAGIGSAVLNALQRVIHKRAEGAGKY